MHYYATKKWKKCGQCVYAKIMCPCHFLLPSAQPPLNNKQFLLLLQMTGNTKSPSLATFMKLVKWMGIKMHVILLIQQTVVFMDCLKMIALTLVFWGYLKKKNWYTLSLWKDFFLTVGRSTRCTIFSSTYISLQKVQYSAVCTYNLNTNTTSNLCSFKSS